MSSRESILGTVSSRVVCRMHCMTRLWRFFRRCVRSRGLMQ
uniref:Uncharacterized protein n=1 Tax=Arundo donax TaxID=35708 RepID=A0A0A9FK03_ARUDO